MSSTTNQTIKEFEYYAIAKIQGDQIIGFLNGAYDKGLHWNHAGLLSGELILFNTETNAETYMNGYTSNKSLKRIIKSAEAIAIIKLEVGPVQPEISFMAKPKHYRPINHTVSVITSTKGVDKRVLLSDSLGESYTWTSTNYRKLPIVDCHTTYANVYDAMVEIEKIRKNDDLYEELIHDEKLTSIDIETIRVTEVCRTYGGI